MKVVMKCRFCDREVIQPFHCSYCSGYFCAEHRLPENHSCLALPKKPSFWYWKRTVRPSKPKLKRPIQQIVSVSRSPHSRSKTKSRKRKIAVIIAGLLCIVLIGYWFYPQYLNLYDYFSGFSRLISPVPEPKYVTFPFSYVKEINHFKFEITVIEFNKIARTMYIVRVAFKNMEHRKVYIPFPEDHWLLIVEIELFTSRGNFYEKKVSCVTHFAPEGEKKRSEYFGIREDEQPVELRVIKHMERWGKTERFVAYIFKLGS